MLESSSTQPSIPVPLHALVTESVAGPARVRGKVTLE